jgi:nucleotide-binding universal stress UspA family protein
MNARNVPNRMRRPRGTPLASLLAEATMFAIKHILVPTDFSEPSERALATALELARAFDAQITLLHVWSIPNTGYAEALAWPYEAMETAARRALDEGLAATKKLYAKTEGLLREGNEWRQVLDVADELGVDLVVMGTHGRRGLPRLVLGSVAEKVVRLCPVPVLTVSAPKKAEKEKR